MDNQDSLELARELRLKAGQIESMSSHSVAYYLVEAACHLEHLVEPIEEPKKPFEGDYIDTAAIEKLLSGETVKSIAKDLNRSQTAIIQRLLKVFRNRNEGRFNELGELGDYGCYNNPSMRLLIQNRRDFGFQ